jgi:sigma-54 specific flagellar transcriptional regulator A
LVTNHLNKIVGDSGPTRELKRLIELVAPSDGSVVIKGATGSGKELVAEALHELSRRKGAFVAINCAAIPKDLLESELFGYEKGAFTGALKSHAGRFEQADKGTLFLDEIGDMSLDLQSKILRVLETQKIQRIGSNKDIKVDVRTVCATHKDLVLMTEKNEFRADLLFRLNVFPIDVPTLRERASDIPLLIKNFQITELRNLPKEKHPQFTQDAFRALSKYSWPGNIRELKNVVIRASILFPGSIVNGDQVSQNLLNLKVPDKINKIQDHDLTDDLSELEKIIEETTVAYMTPPSPEDFRKWFEYNLTANLRGLLSEIEITMIEAALESEDRNIAKAASKLTINRTTLIEKIKKYGIE